MDKFIIIGPQGAGKGTQAQLLCADYDFVHISIGDIFRWNMANHTKLAARVTRIMNEGRLVPDEIVEEVVRQRLEQHDWNYGFVLDGFPRTRSQAEYLFENWNLDKAVYLDIPDDIVFQRVMSRAALGQGSGFTKRADDNPAALKVRLREFHDKTAPLLQLFHDKGMLETVDANRPVAEVFEAIRDSLHLGPPVRKRLPDSTGQGWSTGMREPRDWVSLGKSFLSRAVRASLLRNRFRCQLGQRLH